MVKKQFSQIVIARRVQAALGSAPTVTGPGMFSQIRGTTQESELRN